ncbi:high mobility group protein B3-like [Mytilus galloprovincialis]|uniref:High mobility group protein B1 n=1 Tax=Mytilus galloprovincialis TaxID=29158 RepID=A0A8B6BX65_MYTGA|nr:high mobility group protein B1 [Mytilus galloprovincialis]
MGRTKAGKRPKDENKPKRSVSAYFYYLAQCREDAKASGKAMTKVGEFTKEASVKWGAMNDVQKKKFNDLAAKDKARYNEEMQAFTGKPMKDENKPKRPQSAYFLFLADYRIKMKGSDISNKDLICSAGKVWGDMSSKEKKPYQDKNAEEVKKFEKLMKDYKENGGAASAAKKAKVVVEEPNGASEEEDEEEEDEEEDDEEEDEDDE